MTRNRQQELREQTDIAVRMWQQAEAALSQRGDEVVPGELYLFRNNPDFLVQWAAISEHPDDPQLLFIVPADLNPMAGSADVIVPETATWGPITLRCACGLWVARSVLGRAKHSGFLEAEYLVQAQEKMAQLARGNVEGTPEQEDADFDPDYKDWMNEVAAATNELSEWIAKTSTDTDPTGKYKSLPLLLQDQERKMVGQLGTMALAASAPDSDQTLDNALNSLQWEVEGDPSVKVRMDMQVLSDHVREITLSMIGKTADIQAYSRAELSFTDESIHVIALNAFGNGMLSLKPPSPPDSLLPTLTHLVLVASSGSHRPVKIE